MGGRVENNCSTSRTGRKKRGGADCLTIGKKSNSVSSSKQIRTKMIRGRGGGRTKTQGQTDLDTLERKGKGGAYFIKERESAVDISLRKRMDRRYHTNREKMGEE